MKTVILILSTVLLFSLTACHKSTLTAQAAGNGSWTATVNGQQKSGSGRFVYQGSTNDLVLTMTPTNTAPYPDISVSVGLYNSATLTTGTYPINALVAQGNYFADSSGTIYVGNHGQLVLSQFSTSAQTVAGTFYFTGIQNGDSVVISNGTFTGPLSILH